MVAWAVQVDGSEDDSCHTRAPAPRSCLSRSKMFALLFSGWNLRRCSVLGRLRASISTDLALATSLPSHGLSVVKGFGDFVEGKSVLRLMIGTFFSSIVLRSLFSYRPVLHGESVYRNHDVGYRTGINDTPHPNLELRCAPRRPQPRPGSTKF